MFLRVCVQQVDSGVQQAANAINLPNPPNSQRSATVKHVPSIPAASSAPSANHNNNNIKQLPCVSSNIDDFINNNAQLRSQREREISTSSAENEDNYDFEPYTRRDFRIDVKPGNNDNSSGYFTSPNENEKLSNLPRSDVLSPESDFEYQKSIVKHRDEYSSSPNDSQSGRSASGRKSVSFDLDVEEYTPQYSPDDNVEKLRIQKDDDDIFYEKSHYHHHQLQPEPKRIKGILRSPSPSVYYKGNVSNRVAVEKEYIDDDDESEKENPFRKEYLEEDELLSTTARSVASDSDATRQSFENLSKPQQSKIPIMKPIFKASGSLVDRPKIPPPRPPQPNIKVAAVVKNEGLHRMSQNMEEFDFLEFVHNAETNTVEAITFDPDDPLPPLPKCPPPPLNLQRSTSVDRPKNSPPPPPTPRTPKGDILEILPAKFDTFPIKQKPHFVNENSQNNILVSEDEHREILLTENELRNALLTEYDDRHSAKANAEMLIPVFSPTNPFLDETASSFDSCSFPSTPNILSPTSTLDKSVSSFGQYVPAQQMNILPPPAQVLPVHYGQLPKPQHAGYYPLVSHQHPVHYNAPSTGHVLPTPPNQSESLSFEQQQQQHFLNQQRAYLVSGDGQNNFYVTHNVNNTANNQQQQHQTLLMQSAYGPPPPLHPASMQLHMQPAHSQYVASTQPNYNQPQFIYEQHHQQHQQQPRAYYQSNVRMNNNQYQQTTQHFVEPASELSPIRINQIPQNFIYPTNAESGTRASLSSFGKQTEV